MKYFNKSRRMFLQGTGGSFLAIPFLDSLIPREARAASVVRPKYIQLVSSESGSTKANSPVNLPKVNLGDRASAVELSKIIQSSGKISKNFGPEFNNIANKINLISNTVAYSKWNEHNECVPTTGGGTKSLNPGGGVNIRIEPHNPYSLDYRLEQNIYRNGPAPQLKAIRMNLEGRPQKGTFYHSAFSYNGAGLSPGTLMNIEALKNTLGLSLSQQAPAQTVSSSRRDLLSAIFADYKNVLTDKRLSSQDKTLLESAVSSIADIQRAEEASDQMQCVLADNPQADTSQNYAVLHKRAIDIIVTALSCGITDIAAYTIHQFGDTNFDRASMHGQHHNINAPEQMDQAQAWRNKIVAYFIQKLADTPSPSGMSLLDDSLLYYGQEWADIHATHIYSGHTSLLAGSAGGALKTGLHIDAGGAPLGRVLITIMKAFGLSTAQIEAGAEPGFGMYATEFWSASSVNRGYPVFTYPKEMTDFYFTLAEKRKALPILV